MILMVILENLPTPESGNDPLTVGRMRVNGVDYHHKRRRVVDGSLWDFPEEHFWVAALVFQNGDPCPNCEFGLLDIQVPALDASQEGNRWVSGFSIECDRCNSDAASILLRSGEPIWVDRHGAGHPKMCSTWCG